MLKNIYYKVYLLIFHVTGWPCPYLSLLLTAVKSSGLIFEFISEAEAVIMIESLLLKVTMVSAHAFLCQNFLHLAAYNIIPFFPNWRKLKTNKKHDYKILDIVFMQIIFEYNTINKKRSKLNYNM